jgi:transposase InsO family protein
MSSALTNLVPVLIGPNYNEWEPAMTSYLMSQSGQWRIITTDKIRPIYFGPGTSQTAAKAQATDEDEETEERGRAGPSATAVVKETSEDDNLDEVRKWDDLNNQALGNIRLRLHYSIQHKYRTILTAGLLWEKLADEYNQPGIMTVYLDFKAIMDTHIPDNADPSLTIDKIMALFGKLHDNGVQIPATVQAMILMSKMPRYMDSIAQLLSQEDIKKASPTVLRKHIILAWEQKNGHAPRRNPNQAHKISAVQRGPKEPTFQQQQREGDGGNRRGRGRRGGRGRKQQGPQAQPTDAQPAPQQQVQQQAQAGPSSTPAPQQFQSVFGAIAAPTLFPRSTGFYTSFNRAIDLTHKLGVPATTENVKRLELSERIQDPRPLKQRKSSDDEVSLYSVDAFMDDAAGATTGNTERYAGAGKAKRLLTKSSLDSKSVRMETSIFIANPSLLGSKQEQPLHTVDKIPTWIKGLYTEPGSSSRNILPCFPSFSETEKPFWMLDSGASRHFTFDINDFVVYEAIPEPIEVLTATTTTNIVGMGTVIIRTKRGAHRISPVWYIPELTTRLLSLGQFLQSGLSSRGSARAISLYTNEKNVLSFYPRSEDDTIYVIESLPGTQEDSAYDTIHTVDYSTMHQRLSHPSDEVLRRAFRYVKDFPKVEIPEKHICPGCAQGKMTNKSFPTSSARATEPFELIHSDLKMFPIESYHKYRYAIIFYDDYTSHAWTINLRTKDAALPATRHFLAMVETRYQMQVRGWMSDAGGEYTSKAFVEMMKNKGIQINQSVPHAHQQNGRAERIIRTLTEKAESMRLQACLPQSWWEFALDHATHVYNRTPMRRLEWRTPTEWLNKERPTVEHLRVFGCAAYVFIPAEVRENKLAPKSELMVYLGNHPGGKGWIFMRGPNNIIFSAAQATFDESLYPKCPKASVRPYTRLQTPAPTTPHPCHCDDGNCQVPHNEDDDDETDPIFRTSKGKGKERARDANLEETSALTPHPPSPKPAEPVSPPKPMHPPVQPRRSQREKKVPVKPGNIYGDKHPVLIEKETRKMADWKKVVGERSSRPQRNVPGQVAPQPGPSSPPAPGPSSSGESEVPDAESEDEVRDSLDPSSNDDDDQADAARLCREGGVSFPFQHLLLSKAVSEQQETRSSLKEWTYRDIMKLPNDRLPEWEQACQRELETLSKRQVFEVVKRPSGRKVIKNRWVFDVKDDGRKRARLVAKGFSQVEGMDYDQVFSPVVRFETVRLILALAALEDWVAYGLDVRNAYLYGELDEELYMEQPEGFTAPGTSKESHVLRLLRALYGLKQAGLAWWRALKQSMEEMGFVSLTSDAGIFIYRKNGFLVVAVIYVDDAIFCGPNKALVIAMKETFMRRWETRDLGEVTEFLRMRITREGRSIHIDQCAYLRVVLERCGMLNAKSAATPLPAGYVPKPSEEPANPERRSRFQVVIGSLLYLMLGTRPDISFAVTKLAQYSANPSEDHLSKALYICHYLVGTQNYRLTYDGASSQGLNATTDSDWASDATNRRSQSGYFVKLAGGPISWTSRAQKTIALSSTEAEYMALSDCSRQVVWMHTLMGELGYTLTAVPICGDNQGSIFIASNPVTEKRSKHIDIRYHYVREVVNRGLVKIYFIDGDENPADLLTKNLGSVKFLKFRAMLGLEFFPLALDD